MTRITQEKNAKLYFIKSLWNHVNHLHKKKYESIVIQNEDQDDEASDEFDAENKYRISLT